MILTESKHFFSDYNPHKLDIQIKKCYHHQILMYLVSTLEEGKKLKQIEVEVEIIIKMKRHISLNLNFLLNGKQFHQVMNNTDKQRYFLDSMRF